MSLVGAAGQQLSDPARVYGMTATRYRIVDADTRSNVAVGPITTGIT